MFILKLIFKYDSAHWVVLFWALVCLIVGIVIIVLNPLWLGEFFVGFILIGSSILFIVMLVRGIKEEIRSYSGK